MSDGVKLEACPFCGGEAIRWPAGELADEGVINELAGCYGNDPERRHPFLRMTPTAWNTRKSDDGWRTMESAPKDGTEVLVYKDVASVPVVHIAWYRSEEEWNESGQHCGGWDTLEEWLGWWSYTRNSVTQERLDGWAEPSHWRPLPSPPEE